MLLMEDETAERVRVLREGDDASKMAAAKALGYLARYHGNRVLIAEAGAIPPLVELLRDGGADAKYVAAVALRNLASNNDANAVAIAAAVGLEALVQLARRGRVTVDGEEIVRHASLAAKGDAARLLLRKCLPRAIPDEIAAATALFLV